jgi:hypothetical protein
MVTTLSMSLVVADENRNRLRLKQSIVSIFVHPQAGDVVVISGPAKSGKTTWLIDLAARYLPTVRVLHIAQEETKENVWKKYLAENVNFGAEGEELTVRCLDKPHTLEDVADLIKKLSLGSACVVCLDCGPHFVPGSVSDLSRLAMTCGIVLLTTMQTSRENNTNGA